MQRLSREAIRLQIAGTAIVPMHRLFVMKSAKKDRSAPLRLISPHRSTVGDSSGVQIRFTLKSRFTPVAALAIEQV
jgi:hypothetical protein